MDYDFKFLSPQQQSMIQLWRKHTPRHKKVKLLESVQRHLASSKLNDRQRLCAERLLLFIRASGIGSKLDLNEDAAVSAFAIRQPRSVDDVENNWLGFFVTGRRIFLEGNIQAIMDKTLAEDVRKHLEQSLTTVSRQFPEEHRSG